MAAKKKPEIQPEAQPEPAGPAAEGVGDRGTEQRVPFYHDRAGRRFVAAPHPDEGKPW